MKYASILVSAALILTAASAAHATSEQWAKEYSLHGRADLQVGTSDGQISVEGWDRPTISVQVITERWHIGDDVRVEEVQHGNRVEVHVVRPKKWISFGFSIPSVRVEIRVPRDADLELTTSDGGIKARGLKGRLTVTTDDGGINASDVEGSLKAHTADGGIQIDGRFDQLELSTQDGSITAVARAGSKLGEDWFLETGDGTVDLRIPDTLNAQLDAQTEDGHISVDIPVRTSGTFDRQWLRGALNAGGPTLRVRSGDGSIRIGAN